jgi:hypothetical protein
MELRFLRRQITLLHGCPETQLGAPTAALQQFRQPILMRLSPKSRLQASAPGQLAIDVALKYKCSRNAFQYARHVPKSFPKNSSRHCAIGNRNLHPAPHQIVGGSPHPSACRGDEESELSAPYDLQDCSPPKADFCPEAPARPVTQPNRSVATMSYRQLHRWVLPLVDLRRWGAPLTQ